MGDGNCPPRVRPEDEVVLFDAVCKLCSGWARFLVRHDVKRRYRLASVQSEEGADILRWFGLPTDRYETLVLVRGERMHIRSAAVIRVLAGLPFPWKLGALFWIVPGPLRDWAYDRVALNRYRLFGKLDRCIVPSPDHLSRFLHD